MRYKFDFSFLADRWPSFLEGAWLTIQLTVVAIVLGFIVGTVCAILRVYGPGWVRRLVGAYVETIRNTPLLVQLYIVYFVLPKLGLRYFFPFADNRDVTVDMTLTTPNCPSAQELPIMVENAVSSVAGVGPVTVNIVWDPPWEQSRMSDEARATLNMW